MTPLRRTTLQCSQIFFTDARTFMMAAPFSALRTRALLVPVNDPAARQVVGGHLHRDLVARQDLDEVHPHLARDVGQQPMAVLQLHAKRRVRERLDHGAFDLDALFLRQTDPFYCSSAIPERISGPSGPTATVCSKCADHRPSFVATAQPSGRPTSPHPPASPTRPPRTNPPTTPPAPVPHGPGPHPRPDDQPRPFSR